MAEELARLAHRRRAKRGAAPQPRRDWRLCSAEPFIRGRRVACLDVGTSGNFAATSGGPSITSRVWAWGSHQSRAKKKATPAKRGPFKSEPAIG